VAVARQVQLELLEQSILAEAVVVQIIALVIAVLVVLVLLFSNIQIHVQSHLVGFLVQHQVLVVGLK
jgi:hypothetical protein